MTDSWNPGQQSRFDGSEKDSRLAQLRADTDATFSSLDAHYEQQHSQLSRELFEKILTM